MIKFLFVLLSVENIYLCMSKSPRQKKKLKLKVTKRGKRRNTKGRRTRLSNNRRMTMKKKGGTDPLMAATGGLGGMMMGTGLANIPTRETINGINMFHNIIAEDIERKGAYILREVVHILRQSDMLRVATNRGDGEITQILRNIFNFGTGSYAINALEKRKESNKQQIENTETSNISNSNVVLNNNS